MDTGFIALSGLVGLLLGSFYTACVYRWLHEISLVDPMRSFCPVCEHPLSWSENVPLVSWILQRGRCRHCNAIMHWRYPAVEFTSLVWSCLIAAKFGWSVEWGVFMVFGGIFIVAGFIDLESFLLPDILTIPGTLLALGAYAFLLGPGEIGANWDDRLVDSLIGMAAGGGFFAVLHYGYKLLRGVDGLGLGDVKLMCLIGALLSAQALPFVIVIGAFSALLVSVFYMARSGKGGKTPVPFGPFLSLAAMTWILYGPELWRMYLTSMR